MNKKKWSIILAIFFLVQDLIPPPLLAIENNLLNPPTKANIGSSDTQFKKLYDAVCLGLFFYDLDAVKRYTKDAIAREYSDLLFNSEVKFDFANIDIGKKGWTRYYPFSIDNKSFIMRIFLTSEAHYQPSAPILYEGVIKNPAVTFQVLPSLNEILAGCKIRPIRTYSTRQVDSSS